MSMTTGNRIALMGLQRYEPFVQTIHSILKKATSRKLLDLNTVMLGKTQNGTKIIKNVAAFPVGGIFCVLKKEI